MSDKNDVLMGSAGEGFDDSEMKSRKKKRIIILVAIIIIIAAIVVTLVFVLKGSDGKDEGKERQDSDLKPDILMKDSEFLKPVSTTKSFQLVELKESKYKFILVHDPKSVNAGLEFRTNFGFSTEVLDGLAHYAEHVFFRGTKNSSMLEIFNLVGQFDEFLNAFTWEEETVFQILGSNLTFNETLNIVSEFIQKPALNPDEFLVEVNAVNSEFDTYNYSLESSLNILRDNSNPDHGFSQTITGHTGNNLTLLNVSAIEMKQLLKNYFLTIFKPENCVFLIYSSNTFEDMATRAQKYFGFKLEQPTKEFNDLIDKKIKALDNPLFLDGQLGKIASYNSLRETPLLVFTFEFSEKNKYAEVDNLLKYFFNNYDEGSFQNYLKLNNYISNYEVGIQGYLKNYEIYTFVLSLTKEGLKNMDKIIEAFFSSVNAIKEDENKLQEILNNIKEIENKKYQFGIDKRTEFPGDVDTLVHNYYFFGAKNILGTPINELFTLERAKQILEELSPEKSFITIDSNEPIDSEYLNSSVEIKYLRSKNVPYKINSIPEELISKLKNINSIDDYNFTLRTINNDFSKLEQMTDIPCYEKNPNNCDDFNETDKSSSKVTDPYLIQNEDNIFSLMKIDRTFGIPFIKGYVEIELDNKIKDLLNTDEKKAVMHLIQLFLSKKFGESSLYEGGSELNIEFSNSEAYKIQIIFSTINDILDKIIDYIIDLFKEPIDEASFENLKERYYYSIANNLNSPAVDFRNEMLNIFKRFISVNTFNFAPVKKELIENVKYTEFTDLFNNIKSLLKKIKYLTYGDISKDLAESTTYKLKNLISSQNLLFALNEVKVPNIPYNSSIYYINKDSNKYQVQGRTLVLFEFDESLKKKMNIFSYCAYDVLFDYLRTKRGTGYAVKTFTQKILDKNYLVIYALGKRYSPEKMDRLVNEGINEAFNFKGCRVNLILEHLKNRDNINGYVDDKFENLLSYLEPKDNETFNEELNEDENMTFDDIVQDLQEVFVTKVKRFAILTHRGDESDEDYEKEINELDKTYYLNEKVTNYYSQNITYLEKFVEQ